MHRILFQNQPTSFQNVQAQTIIFRNINDLLELKNLPQTDGVILGSVLQELHITQIGEFLKLLGTKIISGGSILASGIDSMELSRLAYNEAVDIPTFNKLMFGDNNRSMWNIVTLDMMMQQIGFSADIKKIGGIGDMEYFYKGTKA